MTAQNVLKEITEFNVVISVIILIVLGCLITNLESSVIQFVLSVVGLIINLMKKKITPKNDEVAQNNVNWMITTFVIAVMYYAFNLFY